MPAFPLLQIVIVVALALGFGRLAKLAGQPEVVGEMIAGFALGPIVLGQFAPELHAALFDGAVHAHLKALGDLGLVLFAFLVGADFVDPARTQARRGGLLAIAVCSLVVPFALGAVLGTQLHPRFASPGVGIWPFAMFLGTVMSVTAFPVLAAILRERDLLRTPAGSVALFAAAVTDAVVWILLSVVAILSGDRGDWSSLVARSTALVALCVVSTRMVRPGLDRLVRARLRRAEGANALLGTLLLGALAYACATDRLHLHPAFGAFLFGVCLPRDERLRELLTQRVGALVSALLLPCFFALAGLSATAGVFTGADWAVLVLILATAVAGKLVGGILGARLGGWDWRQACTVGVMLNARGLMELLVLKIGMDAGIIGADLFTMFFAMAILTTLMTAPVLNLLPSRRLPTADAAVG
jgi:Kef-type K+ transport system membrane component KefB